MKKVVGKQIERERTFTWGTVEFTSKSTITVTTASYKVVFYYFKEDKGTYTKAWRPFRQEVKRRKLESLYDIYKYADYYGIEYTVKESSLGKRYKNIMEKEV